jgi:HPt (histidine-containing phosphotransfer) domain-containing protein
MNSHLAKPFDPDMWLAAVVQAVDAGQRQGPKNHDPAPIPNIVLAGPTESGTDTELPVLDPKAFDRTAAFLPFETVVSYLETIVTLGETLLQGLRAPEALTSGDNRLVETTHTLAGRAGMFGFKRVAKLGRRFERAVETCGDEVTVCARDLCMAIEPTREEIQSHLSKGSANYNNAVCGNQFDGCIVGLCHRPNISP